MVSRQTSSAPAHDPSIAKKLTELKATFLKICFDGMKFLPAIHPIPGHVKQSVIACNNDVYIQHDTFVHLAEKVFEVSIERRHETDRLKLEVIHDKDIIKAQDEELSSYKSQHETAQKNTKDTAEAVNRLEAAQEKEIDEAV